LTKLLITIMPPVKKWKSLYQQQTRRFNGKFGSKKFYDNLNDSKEANNEIINEVFDFKPAESMEE
ncbi:13030_t:CDS:1, partial [Ambispora gerdemannii]